MASLARVGARGSRLKLLCRPTNSYVRNCYYSREFSVFSFVNKAGFIASSIRDAELSSYPCGSVVPPPHRQFHQTSAFQSESVPKEELNQEESLEFQAETRMLLDIVARSLYSDKEVFIRELISNCSDALEKFRHFSLAGGEQGIQIVDSDRPLKIEISVNKVDKTFVIQDNGLGMTKQELIENLGTIARSGSKAFLEELKGKNLDSKSIIGQFGVGFYSSFMVADKVEVFTRSSKEGNPGWHWSTQGQGNYSIKPADQIEPGTKIVIYLKENCLEFCEENTIKSIIKKYSNFVGFPIYLNDAQVNTIQALWTLDSKEVTPEMHTEFYRFVANTFDTPRFILHYSTDAPINIRCLLYFPENKPGLFELSRDGEQSVALYSRRVLILSKTDNILPKWLRFVKGVVDSEDIPLNLSRELLQNSALIRKLSRVITNRVLRFLQDKSRKEKDSFLEFYKEYGVFIKEGILTSHEQVEKEELGKLLHYESSTQPPGTKITLMDYISRMKPDQRDIYYLAAPSRHLAESSPYYEALKAKDVEVLFCFEPYDEIVLVQMRHFDSKSLISVEKEMRLDKEKVVLDGSDESINQDEASELTEWIKSTLGSKVANVVITHRLQSHPCVITVEEMASARHFIKTQSHNVPEDQRYLLLQPQLEINPSHILIKKLLAYKSSRPRLATLLISQLYDNAMISAGLVDDPRNIIGNFNELLTLALSENQ